MSQSGLYVSIPEELQVFSKCTTSSIFKNYPVEQNFNMRIVKKENGEINYMAYYSDDGDLVKKCHYDGVFIVKISHYRNNKIFCSEDYYQEKIQRKSFYTKDEKLKSEIVYEYSKEHIIAIKKFQSGNLYKVIYKYDELGRINRRTLKINDKIVNEQNYRFDILDRLIEYSDFNQVIKIHKMSRDNQLINYTITDKMGNDISVINYFDSGGYKYTDMCLNGHKISINNKSYVDNIMLKKPYATEDDLDLIISNLLNGYSEKDGKTERSADTDVANQLISENIHSRALPISLRKRLLYNMSLKAS